MGRFLWALVAEVVRAVLPIVALLFVLRAILLAVQLRGLAPAAAPAFSGAFSLLAGLALVIVGLSGFLKGLEFSLLPLGRGIGAALPQKTRLGAIIAFSLVLGALAAVAEPDLKVYADQAVGLMGGTIARTTLMALVAAGAGVGLALGIARIALRIRLAFMLLPLLLLACILTLFCPKPLNLAAWDIAPVVSGAVTVPLFLALGLGLAAVMGGENPGMAGFGLVTLASLGPVLALLLYGAVALREPPDAREGAPPGRAIAAETRGGGSADVAHEERSFVGETLATAGSVLRVIVPVYAFLLGFQALVLRGGLHDLRAVFVGLGILVAGLVLFFQGLEGGFLALVESVGRILPAAAPTPLVFIPVCVGLALVVTFAEPAVLVFARQIEEVTSGAIHRSFLLAVLGAGLAFGFGLGILRIWLGVPLPAFLLPVLLVELALTCVVPERYALIAWDALGVASGTVTVPFFMALGIGIASAVSSEASTAGLGLVMMASVGPVLSVQLVGLVVGRRGA